MIKRAEGGIEKGLVQVDRSHKQHLYEIYYQQIQMAEREERGEGVGSVGTAQVKCIFLSPVAFSWSDCQRLLTYTHARRHAHALTQCEIVGERLLTVEVCLS